MINQVLDPHLSGESWDKFSPTSACGRCRDLNLWKKLSKKSQKLESQVEDSSCCARDSLWRFRVFSQWIILTCWLVLEQVMWHTTVKSSSLQTGYSGNTDVLQWRWWTEHLSNYLPSLRCTFQNRFEGLFLFRWIDDIIQSECCRLLGKHSVWHASLQSLFYFNSIRDDDANAKLHIEFEGGIEEKDNKGFHMSSQREHHNYIPPRHTTNRVSLSLNASFLTIQDPVSVAELFS